MAAAPGLSPLPEINVYLPGPQLLELVGECAALAHAVRTMAQGLPVLLNFQHMSLAAGGNRPGDNRRIAELGLDLDELRMLCSSHIGTTQQHTRVDCQDCLDQCMALGHCLAHAFVPTLGML